jgi:hypothetical protein
MNAFLRHKTRKKLKAKLSVIVLREQACSACQQFSNNCQQQQNKIG